MSSDRLKFQSVIRLRMKFFGRSTSFCLVAALAMCALGSAQAQTAEDAPGGDDSLRIYAVDFVKTRYFFRRWAAFGIYLGHGAVITAAHVVGRWPSLTNPRVIIAGQEIPVTVARKGVVERTDLALLTFDDSSLPVSLRMRLNPVCKDPPRIGEDVVVVLPQQTARSRVASPLLIPPAYRRQSGTVINDVPIAVSGAGVFRASSKCLLGITSKKIQLHMTANGSLHDEKTEYVKYFVPAPVITRFLPQEFRF